MEVQISPPPSPRSPPRTHGYDFPEIFHPYTSYTHIHTHLSTTVTSCPAHPRPPPPTPSFGPFARGLEIHLHLTTRLSFSLCWMVSQSPASQLTHSSHLILLASGLSPRKHRDPSLPPLRSPMLVVPMICSRGRHHPILGTTKGFGCFPEGQSSSWCG